MSKIIYKGSKERMESVIDDYPHAFALSKKELGKTPIS